MLSLNEMKEAVRAFAAEMAARRVILRAPATTLRIRPSGIDVLRAEGARRELLLTASGAPAEALEMVFTRLGPALDKDAALEFTSGLAVVSEIVLPAESPEILGAIVRNKVEGLAPWPLAQCVYGQRIKAIPGDPAHVAVDIAVVSRTLLEQIDDGLAAHGTTVRLASVHLQDDDVVRIDFGDEEERRAAERRMIMLGAATAAVLAAVTGFGLFLAWQASSELSGYRSETAQLMERLKASAAGADETPFVAAANGLAERRRQRASAVSVLNEVSGLLPESVWLSRFALDGDKLELRGQGTDVPALIAILEASAAFSNVNFAAATQLNEELKSDAFSIGATLDPAPESGP